MDKEKNMEQSILGLVRKKFFSRAVPVGAGYDDAAVAKVPRGHIVVSGDMLVEGTHFLGSESPELIGRKAASVSLSDMAAMGAMPLYLMASLGIPKKYPFASVKKIFCGIERALRPFKAKVIGGDTVRSRDIVIDTVIIGSVEQKKTILRSGARKGDLVLATGFFGRSFQTGWHLRFKPRIQEMDFLRRNMTVTSGIDASDGLFASLRILSEEGGSSLHVDVRSIRRRSLKGGGRASLEEAFFDGEDFELVFTGRSSNPERVAVLFKERFHVPLSVIGHVGDRKGVFLFDGESPVVFRRKEFRHFE